MLSTIVGPDALADSDGRLSLIFECVAKLPSSDTCKQKKMNPDKVNKSNTEDSDQAAYLQDLVLPLQTV